MLLDYAYPCVMPYAYNEAGDQLFRNGGRWVLNRGKSEQDELWDDLVPRVARLPYVLTVGEGQGCFHVAHAELMTGDIDSATVWISRLGGNRSEEHTSELQSLMRISYAVFCLIKKNDNETT